MNICLMNDSFPPLIDGVINTVKNYARVITETEGMNAIVATPRYPGADYSCYPYPVVAYHSFDTSAVARGYRAGNPLAFKAIDELTGFGPDIIHSHCPVASTMMAKILRRETGAPIILTYHTKFDEDIAKMLKSKILQEAGIRALVDNISACDEVWTVSRGAGENLRGLGYEGEYRVVSNGVDFPKGRVPEDEVIEAVKGYDIPVNVPVFLFVGRMVSYKGLPLIIDALSLVSRAGHNFRMVFIGSGVDLEATRAKAIEAGIAVDSYVSENGSDHRDEPLSTPGKDGMSGKIIFTGPIRDRQILRAWNTRSHLFLFPSTYDTNGIVVREAAACGLASVLIKGSCAAEDATDGRNGFLIDKTPEQMAEVLKFICEHPEKAYTAGHNAMNELYLSWDDSVRTALGYYDEVLQKKNDGYYDRKRRVFTELAVDAAAKLDQAARNLREARHTIHEGMMENFETISSKLFKQD